MRFRGHRQKPEKKYSVCTPCLGGECSNCPDRLLLIAGKNRVCNCPRMYHLEIVMGEPRLKQVLDPETGSVHTEHMEVTIDGEVIREP